MLTIDSAGAVQGCKVLAATGDMLPSYGCREARAERFETGADAEAATARHAFMTILVYGHSEQLV
jgi:hypothetical protein